MIRAYLDSFGAADGKAQDLAAITERRGTGLVRFNRMEFLSADDSECTIFRSGDRLRVRFHYHCERDIPGLHFGLRIFSNFGVLITEANTWATGHEIKLAAQGPGSIDLEVDFLNLMPGTYFLGIWVSSFNEWHDVLDNVAKLNIEPSDFYGTGRGIEARFGFVFLPCRWVAGACKEHRCGECAEQWSGLPGTDKQWNGHVAERAAFRCNPLIGERAMQPLTTELGRNGSQGHAPRVSVGLPVYNGERYVQESIDSILNQTLIDFELVISDNASTDRTEAICTGYAVKDSRVHYHRNPQNLGAAKNFRRVFELSRAP